MSHSLQRLSFPHPSGPGTDRQPRPPRSLPPSPASRVTTRVGVSGRPGPRYLHIPREVDDVVPRLRGGPIPGRQQQQLVAALRIGARHGGAQQAGAAAPRAAAAAPRVHGSGLRAGRPGSGGSEQRPQEQQHQCRGPRPPPEQPHRGWKGREVEPPGPRTGRPGRGLRCPTAPARRWRQRAACVGGRAGGGGARGRTFVIGGRGSRREVRSEVGEPGVWCRRRFGLLRGSGCSESLR